MVIGYRHSIFSILFKNRYGSSEKTRLPWVRFSSRRKEKLKFDLSKFPAKYIRNFGIIAHIDHGKSTLSDRLMEFTGNISKQNKNEQVLDKLQVERERGITVKAQTVSLFYDYNGQHYLLNLIDTPGHVDFIFEVSRSLAACEGVILLVDANQGVQAQTVANFNLARSHHLTVIPVLNKIDLKNAKPDDVSNQLTALFGIDKKEILKVSAKYGTGIEKIFSSIIEKIPPYGHRAINEQLSFECEKLNIIKYSPAYSVFMGVMIFHMGNSNYSSGKYNSAQKPRGDLQKPFRALLYDSWYSQYRGVICLIMVIDGALSVGDEITSFSTGCTYEIKELGILYPDELPVAELFSGQAGYFIANIKNPKEAVIGDTWYKKGSEVEPLPKINPSKPMVFAGIFPSDQSRTQDLRKAIEKLTLNDSSVSLSPETSPALGSGWRLGFLGLLHMEVFCQRLDQEFDAQVIVTTPGVPYKVKIKGQKNIKAYGGEEIIITNPLKFPDPNIISEYFEPMVLGTIITPSEFYSEVLKLCMDRRGEQKSVQNVDDHTFILVYKFPMSEIITDFFNELKSVSSGFASFDYEEIGYEKSHLTKVDVFLNGKIVEELSFITHSSQVNDVARKVCVRLKENIEPHLFLIAIQACVRGKVVARETIKALKKNVTAKLYGGDVTRRMKLLQRQKEGKKTMRMIGNIEIARSAFINILKR